MAYGIPRADKHQAITCAENNVSAGYEKEL